MFRAVKLRFDRRLAFDGGGDGRGNESVSELRESAQSGQLLPTGNFQAPEDERRAARPRTIPLKELG